MHGAVQETESVLLLWEEASFLIDQQEHHAYKLPSATTDTLSLEFAVNSDQY